MFGRGDLRLGVSDETLGALEVAPSLAFVTLTNLGFLEYTRNLIRSLQPLGLDRNLAVFCIDDESVEALRRDGAAAFRTRFTASESELQLYHEGNFRRVVRNKIHIVYELLKRRYQVLFTDGDVVFLQNPLPHLTSQIGRADILLQNDDPHDSEQRDPLRITLCTGFFLVRPNQRTLRLFNPERFTASYPCDQTFLNARKRKLGKIAVLNRALYPNGSYFLHKPDVDPERIKDSAHLIHFNYLRTDEKKEAMREHRLWFAEQPPRFLDHMSAADAAI